MLKFGSKGSFDKKETEEGKNRGMNLLLFWSF
jgi:hypothetical protein